MRDLPLSTPPRYCAIDRMQLMNDVFVSPSRRYDVFSGVELFGDKHQELRCPEDGHDVWRLYDGRWIKVHP